MPGILRIKGQRPAVVFNKDEKASKEQWNKINHGYVLVWPAKDGNWFKVYKEVA